MPKEGGRREEASAASGLFSRPPSSLEKQWAPCCSGLSASRSSSLCPQALPSRVDPAWQCFRAGAGLCCTAGTLAGPGPSVQTSPDLAPGSRWSPVPKSHGAGVLAIVATEFWLSRLGKGVCCFLLLEGKKVVVFA